MRKALLFGGSLLLFWKLSQNESSSANAAQKTNRKISFYSNESISGMGNISQNGYSIIVPAVADSFYKSSQVPMMKNVLSKIASVYSKEISQTERLTNVPASLIVAYICAESGGKKDSTSGSGAVGLMQLIPISAASVIHLENKKKRLSDEEKAVIAKYIGKERLAKILKASNLSQVKHGLVTKVDLFNPELNILLGSIYLGLLIDEHNENGKIRLDKVTMRYNKGYFFKPKGSSEVETLNLAKKMSAETSAYIIKITGKNGLLDMQKA